MKMTIFCETCCKSQLHYEDFIGLVAKDEEEAQDDMLKVAIFLSTCCKTWENDKKYEN